MQSNLSKNDVLERLRNRNADTLEDLLNIHRKWLYIEGDDVEFIEVAIAATLDREIPGDPVWLFLVAPSGALKTEIIRSLRDYHRGYTLDTLTPATLISGKAEKNKDTEEYEPIAGILRHLDGRCLLIKDFTTILSSSDETRTAIYGQLRSAYDGYFEKAFGTMPYPVRVKATFGLVAGVTPVIDKYTKMTNVLGERFLMVRQSPDPLRAARKASENTGVEGEMRAQLAGATADFISNLHFNPLPELNQAQEEEIIRIGCYIALMRTHVFCSYYQGDIIDMDAVEPEIPTRVSKQLKKLSILLAIIRGHDRVEEEDLNTIRRVAKDSCDPKRQKIIEVFTAMGFDSYLDLNDISGRVRGLYYRTVRNELAKMQVLGILEQDERSLYRPTEEFRDYLDVVYDPLDSSKKKAENGFFSEHSRGYV